MNALPLLDRLPPQVRIEIYQLCGLIRQCPIDLNFENVRRRWITSIRSTSRRGLPSHAHRCKFSQTPKTGMSSGNHPGGLECFCPPVPHQLLLVSRTTYDEVASILYGRNQFKAVYHRDNPRGQSLNVLWMLSPRAWEMMTCLHFGLTYIEPENNGWQSHGQTQPETINSASREGSQMIQSWTEVCDQLLSRIPSSRFKLSLCCNVSDDESALQVVEPLKRLQPIAEAAIWLGSDPNRKSLIRIAKKAAIELTKSTKDSQTSLVPRLSWNDFPREIRLAILGHTTLVDRFPPSDPSPPVQADGFEICAGELLPRMSVCCFNCDSTRSKCNCPSEYAAWSSSCTCPSVPVDLFLVSKLVHAESKEIFFSCNRFILKDDFKASRVWLSGLDPALAGHLRMIDLKISLKQLRQMSKPQSSVTRDWEDLVVWAASQLPLDKIWLSIDVGNIRMDLEMLDYDGNNDYAWLHTSYEKIFDPLYQHLARRKPRRFHVLLCWFLRYESRAEKRLMGPDYNSLAEGNIPWERRNERYPHSEQAASKGDKRRPPPVY